jgi:hypothetical protein
MKPPPLLFQPSLHEPTFQGVTVVAVLLLSELMM